MRSPDAATSPGARAIRTSLPWGLALVIGYVAADWGTYVFAVRPLAITPWNPQPGLAVAFLLLAGVRRWPWVLTAVVASELLVRHFAGGLVLGLVGCGVLAAGYTAVASRLTRRSSLGTVRDVSWLLLATAPVLLIVSTAYVGVYAIVGDDRTALLGSHVLASWTGDLLGVLVVTPLVVALARYRPNPVRVTRREMVRLSLQGVAVSVALGSVFLVPSNPSHKLFYVVFLPMIWVAVTHGVLGAVIGNFLIQAGLFAGLYSAGVTQSEAFEFQLFMGALAISGLYLGVAVTERTVAERRMLAEQDELARALRLASTAEVASSLAHELNQPLSAMKSYLSACEVIAGSGGPDLALLRRTIGKAASQAVRAGNIVHSIREFHRAGTGQKEPLQVGTLISTTLDHFRARIEERRIAVTVSPAVDLPIVRVNRAQIETVLHNLVDNAIDSLEKSSGARDLRIVAHDRDEGHVRVEVHDSGPGVSVQVRDRLFEARSTTKRDGMGLGLAISRSIVEAHGGRLRLTSGEGDTCFSFTLPAEPDAGP